MSHRALSHIRRSATPEPTFVFPPPLPEEPYFNEPSFASPPTSLEEENCLSLVNEIESLFPGAEALLSSFYESRPVCPFCDRELSQDVFDRNIKLKKIRHQRAECLRHSRVAAEETWRERDYPRIEWNVLKDRCREHDEIIRRLLNGEESHFRRRYQGIVDRGEDHGSSMN